MRRLPNFNAEKLNKKIREKDRITYTDIIISSGDTQEELIHIIERHLDDIVRLYCKEVIKNPKYDEDLRRYTGALGLSKSFETYYSNLITIERKITYLGREYFLSDWDKNNLRRKFYDSSADIWEIKDLCKAVGKRKQHYDNTIQEYYLLLKKTRELVSKDDSNKLFGSLIELLDLVAANPYKIWKHDSKNKHIYVAKFSTTKQNRFIMFVTKNDGALETAYPRKPSFTEKDGFFVIYEEGG